MWIRLHNTLSKAFNDNSGDQVRGRTVNGQRLYNRAVARELADGDTGAFGSLFQGAPRPFVVQASIANADEPECWLDRHPRFRRLHHYLSSKVTPGCLPGRRHIDPLEIPSLLPYVMLIDVDSRNSGLRFRFRLIGTAFVKALGKEMTGQWFDEALRPDHMSQVSAICAAVVGGQQPRHWRIGNPVPGSKYAIFDCAMFPLSGDGLIVDMLFAIHALDREIAMANESSLWR